MRPVQDVISSLISEPRSHARRGLSEDVHRGDTASRHPALPCSETNGTPLCSPDTLQVCVDYYNA